MKAFGRSAFRLFKKHTVRLITIAAIVMVSVGFMAGVGEVEGRIKKATLGYYATQNVSDFYLKSKNENIFTPGFSAAELSYLSDYFDGNIMQSFSNEIKTDGQIVREYVFDFNNITVNKLQLLSGELPKSDNEILAERSTSAIKSYNVGSTVTLPDPLSGAQKEFTVTGLILNPLILNEIEEPSLVYENENLDYVVYFNRTPTVVNDVYATIGNRAEFKPFGKAYKKDVEFIKSDLEKGLGNDRVAVLTLYRNFGIYSLISYAEKVGIISIIFVVFFLLVTMLVVYSNMSRLFDEERGQIACMKTLGYSDFAIVCRYVLFVFMGTIIGGLLSAPLGLGLTAVIYKAFNMQYAMPPFPGIGKFGYFGVTFAIITATTILLTYFTGMKIVGNKPVTLLARKAPKSGKKVILERIPFIWNRLSFKHKSTMRNVLLFKSRFFMTVISIIGSTVLVLAGFGLVDCCLKMENAESVLAISLALIIFSGLLCALVIYNLTNINVSERNREIATLMVLGYTDKEVCGYIFREIYVMSFIGAILGVPLGLGFMKFVFALIDFGTIADINWWTWIVAPAATMLFSFISTLLLRRKITKTDMNASLKTLE